MKKTLKRIKDKAHKLFIRFKAYIKRLLFPLYLFPIKLFTYSIYYFIKFLLKLIAAVIGLIFDCLKFPFKSLKNFLKSIIIIIILLYLFASLFVIFDYLTKQYGWWGKYLCSYGVKSRIQNAVVRVVGGYSEGSGFFIQPNQVLTNFHVIADEPSPKIILDNGKFLTPYKILGDRNADLAILYTDIQYDRNVLTLPSDIILKDEEPLISAGFPLGTDLTGNATFLRGRFIDFRQSNRMPVEHIQTDISLVEGMSGGPLTDQCGNVVGVNTLGLSGLSLFVSSRYVNYLLPGFSDQGINKISVDPSKSPEEAVKAFYTYLKARKMQEGFNLLSREYLQKTNFEEWTNRFKDILDVQIFKTEKYQSSKDMVFVKFGTKNWVDGEAEFHYHEGTWQTVKEDGVYKMLKSKILEVENPDSSWFYE